MSRDILERATLLSKTGKPEFRRLALNINQVRQYQPPPNPAKLSDSRARDYVVKYGKSSWELDALEPTVLDTLIRDNILAIRNEDLWKESLAEEKEHKSNLRAIADDYGKIIRFLNDKKM
jgi:hypothetical protein